MADQIAVALDNAQLFAQLRERLEELEASQQVRLRERWVDFVSGRAVPIYERARPDVTPLGDTVPFAVEETMALGETVVHSEASDAAGHAALISPIKLREEIIGTLGLHETGGRQWTTDEVALIEAVADQMALAIENARLIAETQQRAEREQALGQIGDHFNRSLDMDTLLQTAVRELGQLLQVDEVSVRLEAPSIAEATPPEEATG